MNGDNEDMEPTTDLGLSLGYSNQCIWTRLNNDSGAGVNAGSSLDMTFVASDPLSELVWSPHKGLSLKCTDCSLPENKPSLKWDVGPSNMVLSPPQSIAFRGANDERAIDEIDFVTSQAAVHVEDEVGERASLARSPRSSGGIMPVIGSSHEHHTGTSGYIEEMKNTLEEVSVLYINQKEENIRENEGRHLCSPNNFQMANIAETIEHNAGQENRRITNSLPVRTNEPGPVVAQSKPLSGEFDKVMMTNPGVRIGGVASGSQILGLEVALASEVHTVKQCEALDSPVPNLNSPGRRLKELALAIDEESKNKMKMRGSTSADPLEKLESTAENDLQLPISKDACGQSEERVPRDESVLLEASPTNSRTHLYRRKGKEKALSDGDVNERMSKEEDDSHESVESCNSAGLFSTGKRRCSFEQQLIVGSKRVKKQIQESPASTPFVRQDSSFISWISNMVKGLNKSNQDEAPSLALTLAHPNHGHKSHDQEIITCNKDHDPGSRNMGFQTIFRSLYCPNTKVQETRMANRDYPIEGSKELVLADETRGANITPMTCHGKNDKFCKQILLSGNGGGPSTPSRSLSANIAATEETCKTNSAENKPSCNLVCGKAKDRVCSSNSSLGKSKTNSAENNNSDAPSEGKAVHIIGYRSDPPGSLWITRFSPKTPGTVLNLDHCSQSIKRALKCSTDCTRLISQTQNHIDFSFDQKSSEAKEYSTEYPANVVGRELQNYAPNTEGSFGLKNISGLNGPKSICKSNPILPSHKCNSSEAMASMFARRLDALRHIIQSGAKDDATRATTTCFYCGRSGHDLHDCSEITETELEDLQRNITSYDGAEESPCLCIRCFQLDHWAISCPIVSSSREHQSKYDAVLVNDYSASKVQLTMGKERCTRMPQTKESHPQVAVAHTISTGEKPPMDTDLRLNPKWNGIVTFDKRISISKHTASSSGEKELKENQITTLCDFVHKQIAYVPKGLFDAIRRLRLSRMDILRWKNSHIPLSHLDGFFLRLRLGKWEGGLGGTGYYVACITEAQREKSPQNSKNSLCVNVRGITCVVESKYISNHDFLEDELMAWWCTTLRSGGKILSEDDLKLKLEERKKLGL